MNFFNLLWKQAFETSLSVQETELYQLLVQKIVPQCKYVPVRRKGTEMHAFFVRQTVRQDMENAGSVCALPAFS